MLRGVLRASLAREVSKKSETYVLERGGTLLAGRYRVIELLGVGAMGSVWIAEQLALKRKVVVKFHEEAFVGAGRRTALTRFMREARTLASVHHRNVTELYEVGRTEAGEPYLILELLSGETLAARMRRDPPMSVAEALSVAIAIASGLEAVHAAGILHRDVKPENVFLHLADAEVIPKLLDFGLARDTGTDKRITWNGTALGTPGYMAPEQARGEGDLDRRADLYSLGVTLYEMLSGELPFAGESPMDLLVATTGDDPTPLSTWRGELRGPIENLVMKSVARERGERFPDARTMRLALSALREDVGALGAPSRHASTGRRVPPPVPKASLAKPPPPPKRSISKVPASRNPRTVRPGKKKSSSRPPRKR